MSIRFFIRRVVVGEFLLSAIFLTDGLHAHESPHDTIHKLSHRIESTPTNAALYYARAIEYKSLGKASHAVADFRKVLRIDPSNLNSTLALARLLAVQSKPDESLKLLDGRLKGAVSNESKARLLKAKSDIYFTAQQYQRSYDGVTEALTLVAKPSDDWYLQQAITNLQLGELIRRHQQLAIAFKKSASELLHYSWIDAKLDAGEGKEVKPTILKYRTESRFVSTWNIRLAQTLPLESAERKQVLAEAVVEMNQRLNIDRPDVTLLMDRCLAYHLQGDLKRSKQDRQWLDRLKVQSFQILWLDWKLQSPSVVE